MREDGLRSRGRVGICLGVCSVFPLTLREAYLGGAHVRTLFSPNRRPPSSHTAGSICRYLLATDMHLFDYIQGRHFILALSICVTELSGCLASPCIPYLPIHSGCSLQSETSEARLSDPI